MKQYEEIVQLKRKNNELLSALQVMAGIFMFCRETGSIPGPDLPPSVQALLKKEATNED